MSPITGFPIFFLFRFKVFLGRLGLHRDAALQQGRLLRRQARQLNLLGQKGFQLAEFHLFRAIGSGRQFQLIAAGFALGQPHQHLIFPQFSGEIGSREEGGLAVIRVLRRQFRPRQGELGIILQIYLSKAALGRKGHFLAAVTHQRQ